MIEYRSNRKFYRYKEDIYKDLIEKGYSNPFIIYDHTIKIKIILYFAKKGYYIRIYQDDITIIGIFLTYKESIQNTDSVYTVFYIDNFKYFLLSLLYPHVFSSNIYFDKNLLKLIRQFL